MGRRKTYPVPAEPLSKLFRALATAQRAAFDLAENPYLRDERFAKADYKTIAIQLANLRDIAGRWTDVVCKASE